MTHILTQHLPTTCLQLSSQGEVPVTYKLDLQQNRRILKSLKKFSYSSDCFENGDYCEQERPSMALVRKLLGDAQARFRKMVEENRQILPKAKNDDYNMNNQSICDEVSNVNRRVEYMNITQSRLEDTSFMTSEQSSAMCLSTTTTATQGSTESSSRSSKSSKHRTSPSMTRRYSQSHRNSQRNVLTRGNSTSSSTEDTSDRNEATESKSSSVIDDTGYASRRRSRRCRTRYNKRKTDILDFQDDTEPPSPTPGPSTSSRNNYAFLEQSERIAPSIGDVSLENERLREEIRSLRRQLISQQYQQAVDDLEPAEDEELLLYEDLGEQERIVALESEIIKAKKLINDTRNELRRSKREKYNLANEIKQLYNSLDNKEKELREFARTCEARLRENHEILTIERTERERERWSLLRHARDEAERSLALAAELEIKDQQLKEARQQLNVTGYFSDQESVTSATVCLKVNKPMNGRVTPNVPNPGVPGIPDRGSYSADSGVRVSSDRESATTSVGGTLSDSTTDGTPTLTLDNAHALLPPMSMHMQQHHHHHRHRYVDADSISLISSSAIPHIYQSVMTPRDCSSPNMSPMNIPSFIRNLDTSILSKSVEHLGSPPPELESVSRRIKNLRGISNRSGVSGTWGSISRVFTRSRHRKGDIDTSGNVWAKLTEEGYNEKMRLLHETSHVPMERWKAPTVLAWLEVGLGMPQYGSRCADNIKSGKVLLELNDQQLETILKMTNPMHKKKLRLAIEEYRSPSLVRYPALNSLSHTWVCNEWIIDIGLPQYKEIFSKNLIDARVLEHLTRRDLEKYLNVTKKFHHASIIQGINLLRVMKYDRKALLVRRDQSESENKDPLVWTNERFIQWARDIHLGEYADNLKESGIHGAVVVMEPSFDGEMLANALEIPTSKQMIRRHLSAELEQLILPSRYETFGQVEPIYATPLFQGNTQQY